MGVAVQRTEEFKQDQSIDVGANDNEIERFRSDMRGNMQLSTAVLALGTDLSGVVRLANEMGYQFTAESFEETLRARTRTMLDDRTLTKMGGTWVHMAAPGPSDTSTSVSVWLHSVTVVELVTIAAVFISAGAFISI